MSVVRIVAREVCPRTKQISVRELLYDSSSRKSFGGEGGVYECTNKQDTLIKIFKDKLEADKDTENKKQKVQKLVSMCRKYPTIYHKIFNQKNFSIAWPQSTLVGENDENCGYAMYNFPSRQWKSFTEQLDKHEGITDDLLRAKIARNLCKLVLKLHQENIYIIDFKPDNILVNIQTHAVALIDTDGMSIPATETKRKFWHKKVGRHHATVASDGYIAPENKNLKKGLCLDEKKQDEFALAIILFLLFNRNIHPFMGKLDKNIKNKLEEATLQNRINFGGLYVHGITPIKISLEPYFPNKLKLLFYRAFTRHREYRPTVEEWFQYTETYYNQLIPCAHSEQIDEMGKPYKHAKLPGSDCILCQRRDKKPPQKTKIKFFRLKDRFRDFFLTKKENLKHRITSKFAMPTFQKKSFLKRKAITIPKPRLQIKPLQFSLNNFALYEAIKNLYGLRKEKLFIWTAILFAVGLFAYIQNGKPGLMSLILSCSISWLLLKLSYECLEIWYYRNSYWIFTIKFFFVFWFLLFFTLFSLGLAHGDINTHIATNIHLAIFCLLVSFFGRAIMKDGKNLIGIFALMILPANAISLFAIFEKVL